MNQNPATRPLDSLASSLNVLVLAGGPDRERAVSLKSGAEVAAALRAAGHSVREADIHPDDLSALDAFADWPGDVVFPVLHGKWGEGGGLQRILDERGLPYVGCGGPAAELCMDKYRTKLALVAQGLPTPPFEFVGVGQPITLRPPLVVKAPDEGSSIGLEICHDAEQVAAARRKLREHHPRLLIEQFIPGKELTVGVLGRLREDGGGDQSLPPIQIVPATAFYNYEAKYDRDDTRYLFDIDLPADVLARVRELALAAHATLGVRHMSRVDFMVDPQHQPWILEVNTIPGFTTHSLLPMAAARMGLAMPALVDRLVRLVG